MRKSFRYALYLITGFLIYQVIDSGETTITHEEVKKTLIVGIVVMFILLLIVRVIKQRYEEKDK